MEYTDTGVTDDGWRRGQMVALARQLKLQARPERTCMHAKRHADVRTYTHNCSEPTLFIACISQLCTLFPMNTVQNLLSFFFFACPDLVGILSNR